MHAETYRVEGPSQASRNWVWWVQSSTASSLLKVCWSRRPLRDPRLRGHTWQPRSSHQVLLRYAGQRGANVLSTKRVVLSIFKLLSQYSVSAPSCRLSRAGGCAGAVHAAAIGGTRPARNFLASQPASTVHPCTRLKPPEWHAAGRPGAGRLLFGWWRWWQWHALHPAYVPPAPKSPASGLLLPPLEPTMTVETVSKGPRAVFAPGATAPCLGLLVLPSRCCVRVLHCAIRL